MNSIDKILELAKHSPLTANYLVGHGFHINTAYNALKRAYKKGLLDRVEFTTDTKAKKIAHRYTLPQKSIRQRSIEFITEKCTFTSKEVAEALGVSRNSAISAVTDLENAGQVKRVGGDVKDIKFTLGTQEQTENKQDKCLQELKNYVTICLNDIEFTPYTHQSQKQVFSKIRAILERAEVKDV